MVKPFLILSSRGDEVVHASEAEAVPRLAGLREGEWVQVRMEHHGVPAIDLADWSGIIICGSPFDAGAPEDSKSDVQREVERGLRALYPRILDADFPFLGICYGLGTMNLYLGGTMDTAYGETITAPKLSVTAAGRGDALLDGVPDVFQSYVGHHEGVGVLAPEFEVLVTGEACPIHMARIGEHVWGTQFHPELDLDGILLRVNRYGGTYYPEEEAQAIRDLVSSVDTSASTRVLSNFVALHRR